MKLNQNLDFSLKIILRSQKQAVQNKETSGLAGEKRQFQIDTFSNEKDLLCKEISKKLKKTLEKGASLADVLKIGVLKNFAKFTGKHLSWSLF